MSRFREEWLAAVGMADWFDERGYRLVLRQGPAGMDQGQHLYEGDALAIRMIADRSQWFVEIRVLDDRKASWFDLELWSICLGVPALFHVSEGSTSWRLSNSWKLQPQLDYLKQHIQSIESLAQGRTAARTAACLREAQKARAASSLT